MKKKLILWIACILWAFMIFMFSHQTAEKSADLSQSFSAKIIIFLAEHGVIDIPVSSTGFLEAVSKIAESVDTFVRKLAHFSIYAVLGVLSYELSLCYTQNKRAVIIALIGCFFYAVSDEIHQTFIPGRAGMITDVLLDFCGSFFGVFIYKLIFKRNNKKIRM